VPRRERRRVVAVEAVELDPDAPARVRTELAEEAARADFESAEEAVGAAHESVVKVSN
jgi:hypothetical protein